MTAARRWSCVRGPRRHARLAGGDALEDAARAAVVASSQSVSRVGARAGMPTAAEITAAECAAAD